MKTKSPRKSSSPRPPALGRIRIGDTFKYIVPKPRGFLRSGPRIRRNFRGER